MINLTQHIPLSQRKRTGQLSISDRAVTELGMILVGHGAIENHGPEAFGPVVAKSVADFLNGPYFVRSPWFREEKVHTTQTIKIGVEPPIFPVFHMVKMEGGYEVMSPDEAPLADDYYDRRVVEEVKVETGVL